MIDDLAAAFGPGVRFIDGADGIARRIAHLTHDQAFVRSVPDYALFTRDDPGLTALAASLARAGLDHTAIF
jgi:glutamate racemase